MELTNYECKLIIDSVGYYISTEAGSLYNADYDMYCRKVNRALKIATNVMTSKHIEPSEARVTSMLLDLLGFRYETEQIKTDEIKEIEQLERKIKHTYAEAIADEIEVERQRIYDNSSIKDKKLIDDLSDVFLSKREDIIEAIKNGEI